MSNEAPLLCVASGRNFSNGSRAGLEGRKVMRHGMSLQTSRALRIGLLVAGVVGLTISGMAWWLIEAERKIDIDDVNRRAHGLAHQLSYRVQEALVFPDDQVAALLGTRLDGYRRFVGALVFRMDGRLVAGPKAAGDFTDLLRPVVNRVLNGEQEVILLDRSRDMLLHVFATSTKSEIGEPQGVMVLLHDVSYIDDRVTSRLTNFMLWLLVITFLLISLVVGATWATYDRPLHNLADWMQRLRTEDVVDSPPVGLPIARLASESDRLAESFRAARLSGWKAARSLQQNEARWTPARLRMQARQCLGDDQQVVVVSNREPYMHQFRDGRPYTIVPAGGLVSALNPVLQACGGLWVAHGAGDADRVTADAHGRLMVPPGESQYTLRRVWLNRDEEQGYYYGFSNEGLWPLCHLAHERPVFRAADWEHYVAVNRRFAETVLDEIGPGKAVVLVQDYQLALVPRLLKTERPDLRVGIFWHIPWPNPEAFRICPWRVELLHGMLGADLVGFHLQQYCNNFLDTVDRMVEARLDWDHFAVELRGHTSLVRPFPISIQDWSERHVPAGDDLVRQMAHLRDLYHLDDQRLVVGVDRIDYTKGLPERFRAVGRFFEQYPEHRQRITFVQLGAPSRTHLRRYREHLAELEALADEINWKHQTDSWKPIHFLVAHHDGPTVHAFLRMAAVCIVSSLHDGMNLVAKEFVAAQRDGEGVLILSEFAGAARELSDSLIVNPYDTEQFAQAIQKAVTMDATERKLRMERMRRQVNEFNVYRWAATLLADLTDIRHEVDSSRPTTLQSAYS